MKTFGLWIENREREALETAILGSIPSFSANDDKSMWLGQKIRKVFHNIQQIKDMLKNGEIAEKLNERDGLDFIQIQNPSIGDFVNWLLQNEAPLAPQVRTYMPK